MTTRERYIQAIESRPSNEELKYWASLDTKAAENIKGQFLADLDTRHEAHRIEFAEMMAKFNAERICKSNVSFETWLEEYRNNYDWEYHPKLSPDMIPMEELHKQYDENEDASLVAYYFIKKNDPEPPDPERIAQNAQSDEWMECMARADEIHKARLESVRWLPEPEAKMKWRESQYGPVVERYTHSS